MRYTVYLECNDANAQPNEAMGYRTSHSTWTTSSFMSESDVRYAFFAEVAARLVILKHLLMCMGDTMTPLTWLLFVMSREGATRVSDVYKSIADSLKEVSANVLETLLGQVNELVKRQDSKAVPVVLVVDELQQLGVKRVKRVDGEEISVMRAVVNAACSISAAAVWSHKRDLGICEEFGQKQKVENSR
jgi:hypothetical protein